MPDPTTHPPPAVLEAFALGRLDAPGSTSVEDHLAGCERCQEQVAAVPPDTLLEAVADARTLGDGGRGDAPTRTPDGSATPSFAPTHAWADHGSDGAPDAPAVLAGHAKYQVLRRLGTGGMGTVWLAEHTVMNRQVAVKLIRPDLLARSGATGRFLREVRAAEIGRAHV